MVLISRLVVLPVATALVALSACTVPTPPAGLPMCPQRAEVQLEPPHPSDFSQPRAVSPDGGWVALSRIIGPDVSFSLRRAEAGSPSQVVGTVPLDELTSRPPLVGVGPDGSHVVFGAVGTAATPTDPPSVLQRWDRSTGMVTNVVAPTAVAAPPGVAYPVNPRAISADGRRIFWNQAFFEAPGLWRHVGMVTDAATDAPLAEFERPGPAHYAWVASGGHNFLDGNTMVDADLGTETSLNPAAAAAQAAFPGSPFLARATSDNGRYVVFGRYNSALTPGTWDLVRWDLVTATGMAVGAWGPDELTTLAVTDAGAVLFAGAPAPPLATATLNLWQEGTSVLVVGTGATRTWAWPVNDGPWASSSPDLRTVVYSQDVPGLGFRLLAMRCS